MNNLKIYYYYVTWQLGSNEQSFTGTPITLTMNKAYIASIRLKKISHALDELTGAASSRRILGIFKL